MKTLSAASDAGCWAATGLAPAAAPSNRAATAAGTSNLTAISFILSLVSFSTDRGSLALDGRLAQMVSSETRRNRNSRATVQSGRKEGVPQKRRDATGRSWIAPLIALLAP